MHNVLACCQHMMLKSKR